MVFVFEIPLILILMTLLFGFVIARTLVMSILYFIFALFLLITVIVGFVEFFKDIIYSFRSLKVYLIIPCTLFSIFFAFSPYIFYVLFCMLSKNNGTTYAISSNFMIAAMVTSIIFFIIFECIINCAFKIKNPLISILLGLIIILGIILSIEVPYNYGMLNSIKLMNNRNTENTPMEYVVISDDKFMMQDVNTSYKTDSLHISITEFISINRFKKGDIVYSFDYDAVEFEDEYIEVYNDKYFGKLPIEDLELKTIYTE